MKQTYENAFARLETIVAQIEKGETDLDALAKAVKEAKDLIRFCTAQLERVVNDVNKCLEDGKE